MGQVNRHRSAFTDSLDRSGGTVQPGQVILDGSAGISRPSNVSLERSARAYQPGHVSRDRSARKACRSARTGQQTGKFSQTVQHGQASLKLSQDRTDGISQQGQVSLDRSAQKDQLGQFLIFSLVMG
jgi:hypothetical protein